MPPHEPNILLIVHGSERIRRDLIEAFRAQQMALLIHEAESGKMALQWSEDSPLHFVLTAEKLPDCTAAELLLQIRDRHPDVNPVIVGGVRDSGIKQVCSENDWGYLFQQPLQIPEIVSYVKSRWFPEVNGFRGMLDHLDFSDIFQFLCSRGSTTQLRLVSEHGLGIVNVVQGQIVHAQTMNSKGVEAFYKMFSWKGGSFELLHGIRPSERTINMPWEKLLLEAGWLHDETLASKGGSRPAPPPDHYTINLDSDGPIFKPIEASAPAEKKPESIASGAAAPEEPRQEAPISLRTVASAAAAPPPGAPPLSAPPVPPPLAPRGSSRRAVRWGAVMAGVVGGVILLAALAGTAAGLYQLFRQHFMDSHGSLQLTHWMKPTPMPDQLPEEIRDDTPDTELVLSPAHSVPAEEHPDEPDLCRVKVLPLKEFTQSASAVAVTAETFNRLGLDRTPWVVLSSGDKHLGAYAIRKKGPPGTIYLRRSMARALDIENQSGGYVRVRPIQWLGPSVKEEALKFSSVRRLPAQYCEYWYAVGVSLDVMRKAHLTPGAYAIAQGPNGLQSVKVQLMDRGEAHVIWLSKPVRDAIGAAGDTLVRLYPKNHTPRTTQSDAFMKVQHGDAL